MSEKHRVQPITCQQCSRTYCSGCDSDCPSCCIHRHCQDQLRVAQEELLVAKRNAESWQETAESKIVCDCHTWPTIKEFHEYTVAVEAERDAAQKELANLHEHKFGLYATIEGLEEERDRLRAELIQMTYSALAFNGELRSMTIANSETPIALHARMQVLDDRDAYLSDRCAKAIAPREPTK